MRDVITLEDYRANIEGVHDAVPRILDLFATYDVHATWACVGLVLASGAEEARHHAPSLRPTYRQSELSPFDDLDRPGLDADHKCYFAPKLVREIASREGQEVATHTYSHFYCTEPGQSAEQFDADLRSAVAISKANGITPTSLVFPRNQCNVDYLPVLRDNGISSYRGVPRVWALEAGNSRLGLRARRGVRLLDNYARVCPKLSTPPRQLRGKPLDIPGSRFLRPYASKLRWLDPLRERRLRTDMTDAAEGGGVYHLWWHPHNFGARPRENLAFLDRLLRHARRLRDAHGFRSLTMAEVAQEHGNN